MKRFLIAWIGSLALVTASALPAAAAASDEPGIRITSPSAGQTLTGTASIKAEAVPDSGLLLGLGAERIESITVTIRPRGEGTAPEPITKPGQSFSAEWNTRTQTPYNGVYDVTARVNSNRDDPASATVSNLKINNAPAAPSGVKAALQGDVPVVTWKANSEPDITGYRVLRAAASGSFEQVGSVKTAKFSDSKAPKGLPLRYQIVAVRNSPVSQDGITAKSSSTSPVTIPTPAAQDAGEGPAEPGELPEGVFVPETVTGDPAPAPAPPPPPVESKPLAPIIRSEPLAETDVAFDEELPFGAPLPENFNSDQSSNPSLAAQNASDDGGSVAASPMKFVAAGLFLLVFSVVLARTSRRLLKGKPGAGGSKPPKVSYPTFRISNQ